MQRVKRRKSAAPSKPSRPSQKQVLLGSDRVGPLRLTVVESFAYAGLLSLRVTGKEGEASATDLRRALGQAGFRAGDLVELHLVPVVVRPGATTKPDRG